MSKSTTLTEALKKASTERIEQFIKKLEKEQWDLKIEMSALRSTISKCNVELQNRETK